MQFEINKAIAILERTPSTLNSLLKDLPTDWTSPNEGGDTWSPYDVVGHLINGELTDWVVRTEIILSSDPDKEFEPYDRFAQFKSSKGKTLNELLEEFTSLRAENLNKLRAINISEADLQREGIHPEFGGVSLKTMLSAWVVHDLGHIVQISRVMAKQYKEEAGPWIKYLAVLSQ